MTVQELLDVLTTVKDKSLPVYVLDPQLGFCLVSQGEERPYEFFLHHAKVFYATGAVVSGVPHGATGAWRLDDKR